MTTGDNDGTSWPNAFRTLEAALNYGELAAGDEIHVADGVYKPTPSSVQTISFELKSGVRIYGGYAGNGATDPDAGNPDPEFNGCVLSGDLSGNDGANFTNRSDNSHHVVSAVDIALGNTTLLDGFTIKGGIGGPDPEELASDLNGGGVYLYRGGSPLIRNCIITDNMAHFGAGAYVHDSEPIFRGCKFVANKVWQVFGSGGGILVDACDPILVQCDFIRNEVTRNGGGVQVRATSSPKIVNCVFLANRCDHVGGGLSMRDNSTTIPVHVANCLFVGNYAQDSGGGCRVGSSSRCDISHCTFVENYCSAQGDSTHHGSGGGLSVGRDTLDPAARVANINNCIFWNNRIYDSLAQGSQIALIGAYSGTANINYCNIQNSDNASEGGYYEQWEHAITWGAGRLDLDPDFVEDPVAGSGGWGSSGDDFGDLRLASTSPIVNRGNCSLIPNDDADVDENSGTTILPWDLAKVTRQTQRVDMGAYEYRTLLDTCAGDTNRDGTVNVADLLAVINQWGLTGAPSGDVNYFPCGDGVVGIGDLLTVITYWGDCPGDEEGTPAGAPQTVQDCLDACAPLGIGTPEYAECVEKCINSLP